MSISRDTEYTIMRLSGLSTDDKPTDVKSGSWFREIDTSKEYMYDGANWVEQTTGGGGGAMVAHILYNEDDNTYSCDKTFEELYAAFPNVLIVTEENGIGGYVMASPMAIEVYVFSPNTDFVSGNLDGITFYAYFIKSDNTVDYYDVSKWFYN